MPDGEEMENKNLTDAFRKQLEALEPTSPNPHLTPPELYAHNSNIFIGGDPLAWLDVYATSEPGLTLAVVLDYYEFQAHKMYAHAAQHAGSANAVRGVLSYPKGARVHLFRVENIQRIRGCRFDHAWVPHGLDEEGMMYVNLSVRLGTVVAEAIEPSSYHELQDDGTLIDPRE